MSKDYYKILGVLDDAEDIVIRAAYKALAQKYHPDRWKGDVKEADKKMSEINEAYDVLSNPEKRKAFDATRDNSDFQENGYNPNDLLNSLEADWNKVLEYFPGLNTTAQNLSKISKQLEFSFKVILLESKSFENSKEIAHKLEQDYLEKYFGTDKEILDFAKKLIFINQKQAAKELNQAVKLLGSNVDSRVIINRICTKFKVFTEDLKELRHAAKNLIESSSAYSAIYLLRLLKYKVTDVGWLKSVYLVNDGINEYKMSHNELDTYAKDVAAKHGLI